MGVSNHLMHATKKLVVGTKSISCTSQLEMLSLADCMVETQSTTEMVMGETGKFLYTIILFINTYRILQLIFTMFTLSTDLVI